MVNKAVEEATEEVKMEMTPMIDVTFLLLIFFMCSIKFKVLEGKLQTYLPKDVGVNTTPITQLLEKVDIRIQRLEDRSKRNLEDLAVFENWAWDEGQIAIYFQGKRMPNMKALADELKRMRQAIPKPEPTASDPEPEDPLKMNIEAMKGVIYEDVVKVVDVAIGADFTSITFRGIELDA